MTFKDVSLTIQSFDFLLLLTSNAYILFCIHHQCFWIQRLSQFLYLTKRIKINSLRLLISSRMCLEIWRAKQKKIRFSTFQSSLTRLLAEVVERASNVMSFEDVSLTIRMWSIHCIIITNRWNIACNWNLNRHLRKNQRQSWLLSNDEMFQEISNRISDSLIAHHKWTTTSTKKKSKS